MLLWAFISWWYGEGWRQRARLIGERLVASMDYFSIDLLIKTLFAPFRQISAGKVRGPVGVQIQAFFDRLISRIIGAVVRSIVIVIGCVWMFVTLVIGAFVLLAWGFLPVLPVVAVILAATGWTPWM